MTQGPDKSRPPADDVHVPTQLYVAPPLDPPVAPDAPKLAADEVNDRTLPDSRQLAPQVFVAAEAQPTRQDDELLTRQEASLDEKIRAHLAEGPKKKGDPLIGERVGGRFLVTGKIGAGGMGAVYRARQEGMDRDVAVKVLLGELVDNETVLRRFTLEALAVSRLRHPNTIQIFDYGQTAQGNPYIAMEFLEGQTLHELLRNERPLPIRRALRIMGAVAASLAEAHGKDIVHRDLKPENIFLTRVDGNPDFVKVLDFGVAKLRDNNDDNQGTLTQAGSIFGTPRYMSPEQCSALPVDGRSDLYSLGVMLYEMVVGHAPFLSDQPLSLLLAHVNDPPPPPSAECPDDAIPAEVEELVLALLEKAPQDRLQRAEELSRLCHEIADALPADFDARVSTADAERLGVRLPSEHTLQVPTRRELGAHGNSPTLVQGQTVPMPSKGAGKLLVAVAVFLLAVLAGAAWIWLQPVEPPQPVLSPAIAAPLPPLAPDMARITLVSTPVGATVMRGEDALGTTNLTIDRPKGAPAETWKLVLKDFQTRNVTVSFADSRILTFSLEPLVAPTAPPLVASPLPALVAKPRPKIAGAPQVVPPAPTTAPAKPEPVIKPVEAAKPEPPKPEPVKPEPPKEKPKPKDPALLDDIL